MPDTRKGAVRKCPVQFSLRGLFKCRHRLESGGWHGKEDWLHGRAENGDESRNSALKCGEA
ncbi:MULTISPECIES: hypothetical protein [Bacteroides]|uniref:hypothetical protein n=1 Tax=Bacteroides TaxID=816 RepID=UPI00319DF2EE